MSRTSLGSTHAPTTDLPLISLQLVSSFSQSPGVLSSSSPMPLSTLVQTRHRYHPIQPRTSTLPPPFASQHDARLHRELSRPLLWRARAPMITHLTPPSLPISLEQANTLSIVWCGMRGRRRASESGGFSFVPCRLEVALRFSLMWCSLEALRCLGLCLGLLERSWRPQLVTKPECVRTPSILFLSSLAAMFTSFRHVSPLTKQNAQHDRINRSFAPSRAKAKFARPASSPRVT